MNAPESKPSRSDAEFESMLSLTSPMLPVSPCDPHHLLEQLRQVSAMLGELAAPPAEPALVFRRQGKVESKPIGDGLVVGRVSTNDLAFRECRKMSRCQFTITRDGHRFVLTDPDSMNGTFVCGADGRVGTRELRDGDVIEAGGVIFVFVRPE